MDARGYIRLVEEDADRRRAAEWRDVASPGCVTAATRRTALVDGAGARTAPAVRLEDGGRTRTVRHQPPRARPASDTARLTLRAGRPAVASIPTTPYRCGMATEDTHRLGYQRVDDDPNVDVLVAAMDGTAGWDATRRLRSWERAQLGLAQGERLLDVGCGLGEAALALAQDLGDDGEVVGIDVSERMLRVARSNASAAPCRVRFTVGDASALDEPDDSFDAARSERTLQWLADPAAAVAEMVRVVRPGGRVSLIDTDWSTFAIDVGDEALAALVRDGMRTERHRPSNVGRRLHDLVGAAGCVRSRGPRRRRPGRPGTPTARRRRWLLLDGEPRRRPRRHRRCERRPPPVRVDDPRRRAARSVLDAPHDVRGRRGGPVGDRPSRPRHRTVIYPIHPPCWVLRITRQPRRRSRDDVGPRSDRPALSGPIPDHSKEGRHPAMTPRKLAAFGTALVASDHRRRPDPDERSRPSRCPRLGWHDLDGQIAPHSEHGDRDINDVYVFKAPDDAIGPSSR